MDLFVLINIYESISHQNGKVDSLSVVFFLKDVMIEGKKVPSLCTCSAYRAIHFKATCLHVFKNHWWGEQLDVRFERCEIKTRD